MLINDTFTQVVVNVALETPCEAIKSIQLGWCQNILISKGTLIHKNVFSRYYKLIMKKQ